MSGAARSRAPATSWLQLSLAMLAAVMVAVDVYVGLAALVALAVAWPPAVAWRPVAVRSVLVHYLPFALAWLLFVTVYLRGADALGWPIAPQPALQQLAEHGTGMAQWGLVVVGIVVVAPFCEELLFRGYLFTALTTALPMWAVQAVTAVTFGLVHGLDYALPIAVLALLFGYLRQRHRSLLPAMLAHAVHNGITVAVTLWWPGHLKLLYPS